MKLLIECEEMDEADEFARSLLDVDDQYLETWFVCACMRVYARVLTCVPVCAHAYSHICMYRYLLALIAFHQEEWEEGRRCL